MTAGTRTDIAKGSGRPIRHLPDISTHLAFWLPVANVVMQLANPAVGHGVVESRVDRGRGDLRPIKRARTTAQYLAVANLGSDSDRRFFHEAVHRIHARVTSTASSPVRYNANDAGSQLWVALCLVRYYTDQWQMMHGPLTGAELDRIIEMARPLGTTLNVPEARWPATWAEYEKRFADGLEAVEIDDTVREYLQKLADFRVLEVRMKQLGTLAHKTVGPWNLSMTKFAVPRRIRDEMHWEITPGDLRRRRMVLALTSVLEKVFPRPLRAYYALNIADLRVRRRLGISVF
ncbi:oxygenase MpaB family protein [Dietzia maris]|uniref:oxygenase MpaB family protein n=1 Tax=Dietzia maris TaxID=37915 RepID=UPI00132F5841|nr:oxygenase MpaB family protein [Dietzia maris]MBB0997739.1 DUF2236 domain-containing protein [Dietzia maris]MCT1433131.1 oxygenase MpaB family protein [Dietzia maris]MCT1521785.1 oxygenase MpaB family protein [Dietzia maris]